MQMHQDVQLRTVTDSSQYVWHTFRRTKKFTQSNQRCRIHALLLSDDIIQSLQRYVLRQATAIHIVLLDTELA